MFPLVKHVMCTTVSNDVLCALPHISNHQIDAAIMAILTKHHAHSMQMKDGNGGQSPNESWADVTSSYDTNVASKPPSPSTSVHRPWSCSPSPRYSPYNTVDHANKGDSNVYPLPCRSFTTDERVIEQNLPAANFWAWTSSSKQQPPAVFLGRFRQLVSDKSLESKLDSCSSVEVGVP